MCFLWTIFVCIYWIKNVYGCTRTKQCDLSTPTTVINMEAGLNDTFVFNPRRSQNYSKGNNFPSISDKVSLKRFSRFSSKDGNNFLLKLESPTSRPRAERNWDLPTCHACRGAGHLKRSCNWTGHGSPKFQAKSHICFQTGHTAAECRKNSP